MSGAWHRPCPVRTWPGSPPRPLRERVCRLPTDCLLRTCPVPGTGLVRKGREGGVVEGDAVAPEGSVRLEEPGAERAGELLQRAPPCRLDLLGVARDRVALVQRLREEDVRPPRHVGRLVD